LMDGGFVTAPRGAIYGLHGEWEVENLGIAPDIEVENDPASVAAGHDPQLEKAVQVTLEALKKNPVVIPDHPPYPNYHTKGIAIAAEQVAQPKSWACRTEPHDSAAK